MEIERLQREDAETPGGHTHQILDWGTPDPLFSFFELDPGRQNEARSGLSRTLNGSVLGRSSSPWENAPRSRGFRPVESIGRLTASRQAQSGQ